MFCFFFHQDHLIGKNLKLLRQLLFEKIGEFAKRWGVLLISEISSIFLFSVLDYYPKTKNPFGSDEEHEEESEKPVPLLRKNKSMSMSLSNLNSNTLRNKSMSLISINSTISGSTNTLERRRRRSRKSYRAPEPPKGIRPFSLILETSEKSAWNWYIKVTKIQSIFSFWS